MVKISDGITPNRGAEWRWARPQSVIFHPVSEGLCYVLSQLKSAAQLYKKLHLTRRIVLSRGIKILPVGSLGHIARM